MLFNAVNENSNIIYSPRMAFFYSQKVIYKFMTEHSSIIFT